MYMIGYVLVVGGWGGGGSLEILKVTPILRLLILKVETKSEETRYILLNLVQSEGLWSLQTS